ncbi:MAG: RDD family protein [Deltaproteobacteria bacterium]|nr:MAG: RDD family protein [Deltaproteobacteria bacterium]
MVCFWHHTFSYPFSLFFFFEGIVTATPGKIFTGLSIQKKDGSTPSLFAILVRDIFRLIDYPLFFITGLGMVESSSRRQRLGDWLAGTIVACLPPDDNRRVHPSSIRLSGAIRRGWAFVFDLILLIATGYGILLAIPAPHSLLSLILLNSLPIFLVLYLTFSETLFQTTFGKVICGMKVVREDGRAARFSTIFIRNVFKCFDINPFNYLAMTISSYKQKLGDSVSGTIIVNDRKGFWGWLSIPFMLLFPALLLTAGFFQKNNFWKTDYILSIGVGHYKISFDPIPETIKSRFFAHVSLQDIDLSLSEDPEKNSDTFAPGDTIFVHPDFASQGSGPIMTPDITSLEVLDPNNVSILKMDNIQLKPLRFVLHPQALLGDYTIKLTAKDSMGNSSSQEKKFTVSPAGPSTL